MTRKTDSETFPTPALAPPPLPAPSARWALFLDVDGTLLELAPTPAAVRVDPELIELLSRLHEALQGALALISGRALPDIDRLFAPLRLNAAGQHGLERRGADGNSVRITADAVLTAEIRRRARALAAAHPGVLLEDKGGCLALHYRARPELAAALADACCAVVAASAGLYELQPGHCVYELKPAGADKGQAVEAFLAEAPFAGRLPVMVGDDLTDEHAFASVNRLGGISVRVGTRSPSAACHVLPQPAAVHHWLAQVLDRLTRPT
ncbi:MAG TPA: trehalose-phosphatase [Candidatus Competibacteraceae bacterium]|nr:trehalose-phosphatase [Candidatus Competibacteraceae bacterium]